MTQTWIILGASSSIARAFANLIASKGENLILAGRDMQDITATCHDIHMRYQVVATSMYYDAENFSECAAFISDCWQQAKGVVNLFIAIGYMPEIVIDNVETIQIKAIADINYTAITAFLNCSIPLFKKQAAGHIAVLSSVAGDRGRKSNFIYGGAKAGLSTFLDGLNAYLDPFGVSVTTIKPGFIDTAMTFGRSGMFLVDSPEHCAEVCYRSICRKKAVCYVPWFWRYIILMIRSIPRVIFKRLNI